MVVGCIKIFVIVGIFVVGFFIYCVIFDLVVGFVEVINLVNVGNIGGLNSGGVENFKVYGYMIIFGWGFGGFLVVGVVWVIGKMVFGFCLDYLVIVMFGIVEIIIVVMKNEDWLVCGVKNIIGMLCFVFYEIDF